jgi:AraC-like DNA-binding protein
VEPTRTRLRDERITSVLRELDQIPLSSRRTEAELAQLAGVPVGLLVRAFRQQVGTTPKRYFDERRRTACRRLLAGSETPIKEIALELGFTRLSDFSAWFRAGEGVAPRDYRHRHNENTSPL